MSGEGVYTVDKYEQKCEDNAKIGYLKEILIVWPLNIITLFFIQFAFVWSPKLELLLRYIHVDSPKKASDFGVYNQNTGNLTFVKKKFANLQEFASGKLLYKKFFQNNYSHLDEIHILPYMHFNYIFEGNEFHPLRNEMTISIEKLKSELIKGLNSLERDYITIILGQNLIEVSVNSMIKILFYTISNPFYCFQLFTIVLWIYEGYPEYTAGILFTAGACILLEVGVTYLSNRRIKNMAEYIIPVKRLNKENGKFEIVDSNKLNIGDVFEVPDIGKAMPCDSILIEGDIIVNESVLTGESITIIKSNIFTNKIDQDFDPHKILSQTKHILYTGSKIVQHRVENDKKCLAITYKVRYDTEKGNLIRSVLNNTTMEFLFARESLYILIMMYMLVFISFLILFPAIQGDNFGTLFLFLLDLSTIGIPPALPSYLGISTIVAIVKLRYMYKVMCTSRVKIYDASQINCCVFDKTGTLTVDHLKKFGMLPTSIRSSSTKFQFSKLEGYNQDIVSVFRKSKREENLEIVKRLTETNIFSNYRIELRYMREECLATCHSLTISNGIITGDSLECEIFKDVGWSLDDYSKNCDTFKAIVRHPDCPTHKVGIITQFDFVSDLQRMSVITQNAGEATNSYRVYCKGSPEKLIPFCLKSTVPDNVYEVLKYYTSMGLRVISIAGKLVTSNSIQTYTREQAESNLIFLGFYLFENKLKPETSNEITDLKKADLKLLMATGDNILTSSFIAQRCKLVTADIVTIEFTNKGDIKSNYFPNKLNEKGFELHNVEKTVANSINMEYQQSEKCLLKDEDLSKSINDSFSKDGPAFSNQELIKVFNDCVQHEFPPKEDTGNKIQVDTKGVLESIKDKVSDILGSQQQEDFTNDGDNNTNPNEQDNYNPHAENLMKELDINLKKFTSEDPDDDIEDFHDIQKFLDKTKEINNITKLSKYFEKSKFDNSACYAIDGNFFSSIIKITQSDFISNTSKQLAVDFILNKCVVFARMTPNMKAQLVILLKENGYKVLMCGDGANDCAALKVANVGISLSLEEASIASPFTSLITNISCVQKTLIEGKAAITTTKHIFKLMISYSIITLISGTTLIYHSTYITSMHFILVDFMMVLPYGCLIAFIPSVDKLCKEIPKRTIINLGNICSIVFNLVISAFFQAYLISYAKDQAWFTPYNPANPNDEYDYSTRPSFELTVLFECLYFQTAILLVIYSNSSPYKKSYYHNIPMLFVVLIHYIYNYSLQIETDEIAQDILKLKRIPELYSRLLIFFIMNINLAIAAVAERYIVPMIVNLFPDDQDKPTKYGLLVKK